MTASRVLTHSLSLVLLYKVDSQRKRETAEVGEQGREEEGRGGREMKRTERREMSNGKIG